MSKEPYARVLIRYKTFLQTTRTFFLTESAIEPGFIILFCQDNTPFPNTNLILALYWLRYDVANILVKRTDSDERSIIHSQNPSGYTYCNLIHRCILVITKKETQ